MQFTKLFLLCLSILPKTTIATYSTENIKDDKVNRNFNGGKIENSQDDLDVNNSEGEDEPNELETNSANPLNLTTNKPTAFDSKEDAENDKEADDKIIKQEDENKRTMSRENKKEDGKSFININEDSKQINMNSPSKDGSKSKVIRKEKLEMPTY